MSASPSPVLLEAGVIAKAHGLDGSFQVAKARPALLDAGVVVEVAGIRRAITARRGTDARPLLTLEGITSREALDPLRGEALMVERTAAPQLGDAEFWAEDLVGCAVVDGDREVGEVRALIGLPSCEALEVVGAIGEASKPLLVPLIGDAVRGVDPVARRVDVDLAFLGVD